MWLVVFGMRWWVRVFFLIRFVWRIWLCSLVFIVWLVVSLLLLVVSRWWLW